MCILCATIALYIYVCTHVKKTQYLMTINEPSRLKVLLTQEKVRHGEKDEKRFSPSPRF